MNLIHKIWFIVLLALLLPGCANPFSRFYNDLTGGVDITKSPSLLISEEEPKLLKGFKEEEDSIKMREDGYDLVGYSSFNAGNVDENGAIAQARKVHASAVIFYANYTNTESGVLPISQPNTQTSSTSFSGSAYNSAGGFTDFSGRARTTTKGTQTTYLPYNVRRYEYLATYWVKIKEPVFGVHLLELTTEQKQAIGSNKGMFISAVIKDSPAFQVDFLRGDILRKIEEFEIYSFDTFNKALEKYQGHTIRVVVNRNGEPIEKIIRLKTRK